MSYSLFSLFDLLFLPELEKIIFFEHIFTDLYIFIINIFYLAFFYIFNII